MCAEGVFWFWRDQLLATYEKLIPVSTVWLPLSGAIRSAFLMTEPAVASSDATNIACDVRRDGDTYVINGRKWWSSGAMDPRCKVCGESELCSQKGYHRPPLHSIRRWPATCQLDPRTHKGLVPYTPCCRLSYIHMMAPRCMDLETKLPFCVHIYSV